MIDLDGSVGEGGGSILRQALALSILTGKEFSIANVRNNRKPGGLAAQHLAGLNAAAKLCKATLWGNHLGSSEVYFKPGPVSVSNLLIDVGTAGSTTLLLQSLLLPCIFSGKRISIKVVGGTDVKGASSFDYFNSVFLPHARRFADIDASLFKRGYFPKGGGEIKVNVKGNNGFDNCLKSVLARSQGDLLQVRGVSHASTDLEESNVCQRQAEAAALELKGLGVPINIKCEYSQSLSTGSGITLWAVFGKDEVDLSNPVILGSDCLGEKGMSAQSVGVSAAKRLLAVIDSGCCADLHLADQLVAFIAVAGGVIKAEGVSSHTLSNMVVAEKFLGAKFSVADNLICCSKPDQEVFR